MPTAYDRLIIHYKYKYLTVFSASFDKQDEDEQMLDETEIFNNLIIDQNLTESDIDNFTVRFQINHKNSNASAEGFGLVIW